MPAIWRQAQSAPDLGILSCDVILEDFEACAPGSRLPGSGHSLAAPVLAGTQPGAHKQLPISTHPHSLRSDPHLKDLDACTSSSGVPRGGHSSLHILEEGIALLRSLLCPATLEYQGCGTCTPPQTQGGHRSAADCMAVLTCPLHSHV